MPLYKRTPFPLVEPPESLEPHELVYQVRFTKEIFKDYRDYLNRINLYRQRYWTCKITGKTNLTYEEALVSEQLATQKVQLFPKELVAPVLQMVQLSTLKFNDLVNSVCKNLQERLLEGDELYGKKEQSICQCKILKVLEDANKTLYEVGWIDKDKNVIDSSVLKAEDLIKKKLPFTRDILKSFIRESTYRSLPWIVHEKLANQYGISTAIPEELREKVPTQGQGINGKQGDAHRKKRKKSGTEDTESLAPSKKIKKEMKKPPPEPIKYPIDDLLVQPGDDDPVFTDRPTPSRDFLVPMDCVGDLLMVWDFCSSYSRMLQLWRFSLDDFQNALCHKENNLVLIVECHSALLRLLIKEQGEYFTAIQNKSRSRKVTAVTWTNYICDFLEMQNLPELSSCISTIKRGHYGLLDTQAKVVILRELISQVTETDIFREQLDEIMEQRQALASTRREEALEEGRKKREKELKKAKNQLLSENGHDDGENGHVPEGGEDDEKKNVSSKKKTAAKQKSTKESPHSDEDKDGGKEEDGTVKNKEQRKNYLDREIGKRFIHTNPLGKDRNYNRYWFFSREGRIFIESSDFKQWGYYSSKEELDAIMGSLNPKGERERALQIQLKKSYDKICLGLQKRSKFVAHKNAMEEAVLRRSSRVRAPRWDNPSLAFLSYVNKYRSK
ncbi:hypothetical protein ACHQM5_022613 [Ranunculus cassubicifolius]